MKILRPSLATAVVVVAALVFNAPIVALTATVGALAGIFARHLADGKSQGGLILLAVVLASGAFVALWALIIGATAVIPIAAGFASGALLGYILSR